MTNEELVTVIRAGQSDRIGELWAQVEQFIKKQANRWTRAAEFDDLVQQGFLILHDAAADYEPGQGMKFITYLGQRLEWGWARWLEETGAAVRLPSYMVQKIRQYKRIRKEYAAEHGCEPSESHICRVMDVEPSTLRLIKETAVKSKIRSLNEPIRADDGSGIELQDTVPDETDITDDVLDRVQHEQLSRVIWPMVEELEERQARVIWERYKQNKTLKECGRELGVSLDRARQIEQKAIRTLRKPSNARKLQPFVDDLYSAAVRGTGLSRFQQSWTSATEREALRNISRQTGHDVDWMLAEIKKGAE